MSSRFPIGVATMYKPLSINFFIFLFIFLCSCAPVNYPIFKNSKTQTSETSPKTSNIEQKETSKETLKTLSQEEKIEAKNNFSKTRIQNDITFIVSSYENIKISKQFINIIELAVYKKELKNINFNIKYYDNETELVELLERTNKEGKIFIGPTSAHDTKVAERYCDDGAIFFSFSSQRDLANNCVYLVNFFPENELRELFSYFIENSKIAILYPENNYGYSINNIIDDIAGQSKAIIVNRASYKNDMSNVREAIKELGKYELRKYELNRQKIILANKKDEKSKRRLKKLEKFKTTKDLDFTHVIIADYGIRLLQVAPLLPYYDIDPNLVKFVGTGVWDDPAFFDEPSLQGAIFPGIEEKKRRDLFDTYRDVYEGKLLRISTLPYDLIGLIAFAIYNNLTIDDFYKLLNNNNSTFSGVDGSFYFKNNIIERDLDILEIANGKAEKLIN